MVKILTEERYVHDCPMTRGQGLPLDLVMTISHGGSFGLIGMGNLC